MYSDPFVVFYRSIVVFILIYLKINYSNQHLTCKIGLCLNQLHIVQNVKLFFTNYSFLMI